MGNLSATPAPLHPHAPSMLTGSPNAAQPASTQLAPPLPSTQPALESPQHLRLTLQPRQLHQLACQLSQPPSSVLVSSLPSCKGESPENKATRLLALWSAHSFGNWLQKCRYSRLAGCVFLEYPVNISRGLQSNEKFFISPYVELK